MADVTIPGLTALTSIDRAADLFEVSDTSDSGNSKKTTVNNMLNITSQPMGLTDSQSPTNKTFDNTNIFTIRDDRLALQDNSDTTKQAVFQLSGITTGTTRTYTLPNISDTLVTLTASQTLTNKTLTSPTISAPTISNPTLTVDTISEFTSANGVVVDGVTLKDSNVTATNLIAGGTLTVTGNSTLTGTLSTVGQASVQTATAPPAAGANTAGIKMSSTANFGLFYGSGAPTFSAAQGSVYMRTDGSSTSTRLYVNTNGSTTWTNLTSAT